jgi:hypothetical protein
LEQERNLGVPYFSTCSTSHHHRIIMLIQTLDLVGLKTQALRGTPFTHPGAPDFLALPPAPRWISRSFPHPGFPAGATLVAYCVPQEPKARAGG